MIGYTVLTTNGELYHHGIKGQKWGVRRFQNPDGTLTSAGKKRYGITGEITFNKKGKLIDSVSGKKISKATRKLIENHMLNNKDLSSDIKQLNDENKNAYDNMLYKEAIRDKSANEYNKSYINAYNSTGIGAQLSSGLEARANKILLDNAEKEYKVAKNEFANSQKKIDEYIANYANVHINDFKK